MRSLSWTLLAILAISWTQVQCRSIDTAPNAAQTKAAVNSAVDTAAEIATVELIGEAVDKAIETEVQRESTAQQLAVRQLMTAAENEAVKEILADATVGAESRDSPVSMLAFESGSGDNDNEIAGTRDKRTIQQISGFATCLFTILVNPNCFQEMRSNGGGGGGGGLFAGLLGGGGGGGGRSRGRSSARQEAYNRQLRQWMAYQKMQIAKLNATEGGNYTTPFPILPPSPPLEVDDSDDTTESPGGGGGFIGQIIQFKLNLIPNLFKTVRSLFSSVLPFLQNIGGGGGTGGGGNDPAGFLQGLGGLGGLGGGGGFGGGSFGGSSGGDYGNNYGSSGSNSDRYSVPSSGSSSSGSSGSGSAAESSTYRISLG